MRPRLPVALHQIAGSTPVRQAMGLVAVFTVVSLVTLALAYVAARRNIESGIRANLAQHMAGFDVTASPRTLEVLVAAEADAADPADRVFAFIAPDGRVTGNAEAKIANGSIQILPRPDGRPLSEDGYYPEVMRMAGGILVVAESKAPIRLLGETFAALLVLSLVPTALISFGIGAAIAVRAHRRVERIETALEKLSQGALETRIAAQGGRQDDLERIGTRVNRMAAGLQASTDALRQVSTDIAHDLKTPLQRMSVLLHDLRDKLADGSEEAALAERAMAEANGAVGVFHGLLRIAQIESGNAGATFAKVDLARLAREIGELYQPAAEEHGGSLTIEAPEIGVTVRANRDLVGQAVSNLIENALRHTPAGSHLTVAAGFWQGKPMVQVSDTGPGIPEEERGNVLRRLYRLERSRSTEGNGLGLALVAATAGLHGAELSLLDNRPGLIVRLTFPPDS
ncbi:MAG: HAMP domain-containing histidine kinase [Rhodobacteraceae bacterium]|nr:HAMP domain-containing histidine kinase [Paracoccaceae bacterium]